MSYRGSRRAAAAAFVCLVALSSSCTPPVSCESEGALHAPGETFVAPDGCNQCVCGADGTASCTLLGCPDGGPDVIDAGPSDEDNEVVPVPDLACDVVSGEARPGSALSVSGAGYAPATAEAVVVQVEWDLVRAPAGSRAGVAPEVGSTTNLVSKAAGPDLVGTYVLRARVTDDVGAIATYDCALQVRPPDGLYFELVWEAPAGDLDLHLVKQDSLDRFCLSSTAPPLTVGPLAQRDCSPPAELPHCFFATCRNQLPDWDGDPSSGDGDPRLVFDELQGFGPEAIRIPEPEEGTYLLAVHAFDAATGPFDVSARVFDHGQLRVAASFSLAHEAWHEIVTVSLGADDQLCVTDLATGEERCGTTPACSPAATCAQCSDDDDCGHGARCDDGSQQCIVDATVCLADDECDSPLECSHVTDVCAHPRCTNDADCQGGLRCLEGICVLEGGGPVDCSADDDEPNDTPSTAVLAPNDSYEGFMCVEDLDVILFPMEANQRVTVTVDEGFPPPIAGLLTDGAGEVLAAHTALLDSTSPPLLPNEGGPRLVLVGHTGAAPVGPLYLHLRGDDAGAGPYAVDVTRETWSPLDCAAETTSGIEPNDVVSDAYDAPLDTTMGTLRCGFADKDFFRFSAPPLKSLRVELAFDVPEGDLNARLVAALPIGNLIRNNTTPAEPIVWTLPEGPYDVSLEVFLAPSVTASRDQAYTLTVTTVDRPASCAADVGEPDSSPATAQALGMDEATAALRCVSSDIDVYAVEVPAGDSVVVEATFDHALGDLRLDLLNDDGTTASSFANASTAATGREVLALPVDEAATTTRYVRVRIHSGAGTDAQPYSIVAREPAVGSDGGTDDGGFTDEDGGAHDDAG